MKHAYLTVTLLLRDNQDTIKRVLNPPEPIGMSTLEIPRVAAVDSLLSNSLFPKYTSEDGRRWIGVAGSELNAVMTPGAVAINANSSGGWGPCLNCPGETPHEFGALPFNDVQQTIRRYSHNLMVLREQLAIEIAALENANNKDNLLRCKHQFQENLLFDLKPVDDRRRSCKKIISETLTRMDAALPGVKISLGTSSL